jgi:uncharacterized cupin superfamily protein
MIEATNIFAEPADKGRIDVGSAAQSAETAMFLYDIEPGGASCPYHYEYAEEWMIVVEGEVTVRTPDGEHVVERGCLVRFPAGPTGAHRLMNRGLEPARMLLFGSRGAPNVAFYPDSGKVGMWTGDPADESLFFLRESAVPWSHGADGWDVADPAPTA